MNREQLLKALDAALDDGDVDLAKALSRKLKGLDGGVVTKPKKGRGQTTNITWNNSWEDDGKECANERISLQKVTDVGGKLVNEAGEVVALQIQTGKRPAYEPIDVVCGNCQKPYQVNPLLAVQSSDLKGSKYRCNDCCRG